MISELQFLKEESSSQITELFDVVIIGAGPAGMSAALSAGRAQLKTLLIDKALPGGQLASAYKVYNYLGEPGILGEDLASKMESHLQKYSISYTCAAVENIHHIHDSIKIVETELGATFKTRSIILAKGLDPKPLGAGFERQFLGRGISYFAQGDASAYRGKDVAVIGGGNCACYAAEYLSEFVNHLYMVHRSDTLKSVKTLRSKILNHPKIQLLWNTELVEVFGIDKVEKIKLFNRINQQHTWLDVKGVFIYVGRIPSKKITGTQDIKTDEDGYLITDDYMRTNIKNIYAVGDIRAKQIRQIVTAVSDGMIAGINIERDLMR